MTPLWQLFVSGAVGSSLTYALTWWRERKRMQDAYRAPQRQAIAEILTAGHEFQLSALNWRRVLTDLIEEIRQDRAENIPAISAEIREKQAAYAAAMMGMRRAFEVGSLTVVDVQCWQEMVAAVAAFSQFNDDPDGALEFSSADEFEQFVALNKERSHQLRVAVSALVKTANGRVTPAESRRSQRQRRDAQRRLIKSLHGELDA
ncbi:hypothetical protein KN246_14700 [Mycobacterium intracellulare]|uniref:hypothetical protein n=1 Tax=Mycobacterium intracellulare TaxID=1767 RepID=UPI0001B4573F|nr:hypothetical protein [Mycobacterium intracellulare]OBG17175.1 hypothetical protein A5769_15075 [Mycobacterium intracellulare]UGT99319.1 hypothetical protein LTQ55_12620 [Mycobacterium intracellulare]UGU08762.1 hypothetical protein LTQ56_09070 [Mycobacterium intracellulare subsp. intracellulare]UQB95536.1 hypothetical protein KN246_14700 [Mycobacterium intracellulare]BCO57887.1 hypothetical protein MINTM005_31310 [Mycobacterium intracellulare]